MKKKLLQFFILSLVIFLTSCGEMIDGTAHVAYGFTTFMIGLFKFIGVLILIFIVGGIIITIIKSLFD